MVRLLAAESPAATDESVASAAGAADGSAAPIAAARAVDGFAASWRWAAEEGLPVVEGSCSSAVTARSVITGPCKPQGRSNAKH